MLDLIGGGHANQHGFDREQTTRLQGVALEGHGQGEDKFNDQQPACNERIKVEGDRIDHQK